MFMYPCNLVQFIKKNPTRCNSVSKFYYSIFIWSSTCFGRHTAHHQEPKTALVASGFSYVVGCWTCIWWTLWGTYSAWQSPPNTRPTTFRVWKTRGCQCSFRLLMMGGVSPKTFWASWKYGIIKVWYTVASCWIFLYELYYGFSYVEGCWTCCWWTLSGTYCAWERPATTCPTAFHVWKTRGCQCSFRLLMMGCVSPETFWASYKYGIIKVWYIVVFCWIFLYE